MRTVGRCVAFRSCRRRAKYGPPSCLCSKHWNMWWKYGVSGRTDLPYMAKHNERCDANVSMEPWQKVGAR